MNKLPAKQIYLLTIIIVGIIALSVYSTYALFTFESSTSDIVVIHTPKSLKISENVYEYQQLQIDAHTIITTDIDIYNSYDYEVCYSVWYKVIGTDDEVTKVQVFEHSDNALLSSGTLQNKDSIRTKIVIINDNDTKIKINLGTIGKKREDNSCSLNLSKDRHVIDSSYKNIDKLTTKLLEENKIPQVKEANYLTYEDEDIIITYKDTDTIFISDKFEYKDEIFTLTEPVEITLKEFIDKKYLEEKTIYFCQNNQKECNILYKMKELEQEEIIFEEPQEEKQFKYHITKYDKLIGYLNGENGLRKVNKNDYIYYGDNPNNFIYYNCQNNNDVSTCEIWRIIGFFYDEETKEYNTKIIRNESLGKYSFDLASIEAKETSIWASSTINKYLNEEYKLNNNNDIYIENYKQQVERIKNLDTELKDVKLNNQFIDSKISLLTLSDYLNASICQTNKINEYTPECLKNNWLNNIEINSEWTLTEKENVEITPPEFGDEEVIQEEITIENYIYSVGTNIKETTTNELLEIRPIVFLKSRMLFLEGDGSLVSPYIVK